MTSVAELSDAFDAAIQEGYLDLRHSLALRSLRGVEIVVLAEYEQTAHGWRAALAPGEWHKTRGGRCRQPLPPPSRVPSG